MAKPKQQRRQLESRDAVLLRVPTPPASVRSGPTGHHARLGDWVGTRRSGTSSGRAVSRSVRRLRRRVAAGTKRATEEELCAPGCCFVVWLLVVDSVLGIVSVDGIYLIHSTRMDDNAESGHTKEAILEKICKKDYIGARSLVLEALMDIPLLWHYGIDWYLILQLSPSAELADIEAKYSMLVSQLNSIKNDFRVVVERAAARCNFEMPYLSEMATHEASEDTAEQQQKKICTHEESCVTSQKNSKDGIDLYLKRPEENASSSSSQFISRKRPEPDFYNFENNTMAEVSSRTGQIWGAYNQENMPHRYAQIDKIMPDMFHLYVTWFKPCIPQSQDEKKWFDVGLPIACGSLVLESNKFTFSNRDMLSHLISNGITNQQFEIYSRKGEVWVVYRDWGIGWCSSPLVTKNCDLEMVEIITDYLEDLGVTAAYLPKVAGYKNVCCSYLERGNVLSINISRKKLTLTMSLHSDLRVGKLMELQKYNRLRRVKYWNPKPVSVIFIESHPMIDEEIQWVEENLPLACGIFRAGNVGNLDMSRFSHLVKYGRSKKQSFYRIFPKKGEIWAVYKNWNNNQKDFDFVGYLCQVVEILSDFSEESGTSISSLVEVEGCMTFSVRKLHEGFQLTKQLQRLEMLVFSHRIPAFTVVISLTSLGALLDNFVEGPAVSSVSFCLLSKEYKSCGFPFCL
ncbi:hypothetical protein MUK42_32918 [Musa troglodytarum]|uniref:DUF3444 domain-containing protein n=1 Tax=Musa troglodytarum TaxID=320322 RepID=A0A9E7G929_9LILI|nr:hypothetical protein MUK42_32918 [Musa troglodytarum]